MKKVLILDGQNCFIRSFVTNPSIDPRGEYNGGTLGFLKSLQKLIREIKPSKIVIAWDGPGGSTKRKGIVKEYKHGRKPIKLNRNIDHSLTEDEQKENKQYQYVRLLEYLNDMPVAQLMIEGVEADDIVSYVCQMPFLSDHLKVIVSTDKDFFQLCSGNTMVVRPVHDTILNEMRIVKEFSIHPSNFALARAIIGDTSDNLPGVRGAGLKTVAKRFPFLKEEKTVTISELFKFCTENKDGIKLYQDILNNKELIETNYRMMQLYSPYISADGSKYIREVIEKFSPSFNRLETEKRMIYDNFFEYSWDNLFQIFRSIVSDAKHQ